MEMNDCLYLQQTGVRELDRVQRCYQTTHLVREALADPILREYCSRFIKIVLEPSKERSILVRQLYNSFPQL